MGTCRALIPSFPTKKPPDVSAWFETGLQGTEGLGVRV